MADALARRSHGALDPAKLTVNQYLDLRGSLRARTGARYTALLGDHVRPSSGGSSTAATAPDPPTNAAFSRALGRALHRPAFAPVPGFAVRLLYGEMADIVVFGQRAVPERAHAHGFRFTHPDLDEALDLAQRLAAAADAGRVDLSDLGRRARRLLESTTVPG